MPSHFAHDFPESARQYAEGQPNISPLTMIFGAAAYGMLEMGMTEEEVRAVVLKGLVDLTGKPPAPEAPPVQE